jgi:hypothetical protein
MLTQTIFARLDHDIKSKEKNTLFGVKGGKKLLLID